MKSIYEICRALPDADGLPGVRMQNASTPLDFDRIHECMVASRDALKDRAAAMLARFEAGQHV